MFRRVWTPPALNVLASRGDAACAADGRQRRARVGCRGQLRRRRRPRGRGGARRSSPRAGEPRALAGRIGVGVGVGLCVGVGVVVQWALACDPRAADGCVDGVLLQPELVRDGLVERVPVGQRAVRAEEGPVARVAHGVARAAVVAVAEAVARKRRRREQRREPRIARVLALRAALEPAISGLRAGRAQRVSESVGSAA